MGPNVRVVNLSGELRPTPGRTMQNIEVNDTVQSLADLFTMSAKSTHAIVSVDTADIRFTVDGEDPVADTYGHMLAAGQGDVWDRTFVGKVKVTRDGGTNGYLRISEMAIG